MSIKDELQQLVDRMNEHPEHIQSLHGVFQFNLTDSGTYRVVFQNGTAAVTDGEDIPSDCTLILSENNLQKLMKGDLNTTMAFLTGSLKVEGKLGLALKLQEILREYQ